MSTLRLTGATRLYAIVGDPIAQVGSPALYTPRLAELGTDAVLVPAHVPAAAFDAVIPGLMGIANLDGLLVTVPFKGRMVRFAQRLGRTARSVDAVNALRRERDGTWSADMFDGLGFVRGALAKGHRVAGRNVVLLGAGGAGSAIAFALADAGVEAITLVDADPGKARTLATRLAPHFAGVRFTTADRVPREHDMLVNATPVGMRDEDGLPAELPPLQAGTLVGDVVLRERATPLVALAARHGCATVDGRDMLEGQRDAVIDFWLRRDASSGTAPTAAG